MGNLPQGWLADADFQTQVGVSGTVAGSMSTQQCEKVRRWAASRMAANTFDDDLDPTNGDTGQFGAGPVVDFTGGVGPPELAASQTMSPGVPPVYKPKRADGTPGLELNSDDAAEWRHDFGHVWLQPRLRCSTLGRRGRKLQSPRLSEHVKPSVPCAHAPNAAFQRSGQLGRHPWHQFQRPDDSLPFRSWHDDVSASGCCVLAATGRY